MRPAPLGTGSQIPLWTHPLGHSQAGASPTLPYDVSFPLRLGAGPPTIIGWHHGETPEAIAYRFVLDNKLAKDFFADVQGFVAYVIDEMAKDKAKTVEAEIQNIKAQFIDISKLPSDISRSPSDCDSGAGKPPASEQHEDSPAQRTEFDRENHLHGDERDHDPTSSRSPGVLSNRGLKHSKVGQRLFRFVNNRGMSCKVALQAEDHSAHDLCLAVARALGVSQQAVESITYTDRDGDLVDLLSGANVEWVLRNGEETEVVEIKVICNNAVPSDDGGSLVHETSLRNAHTRTDHGVLTRASWRARQRARQQTLVRTTLQERREQAKREKQLMAQRLAKLGISGPKPRTCSEQDNQQGHDHSFPKFVVPVELPGRQRMLIEWDGKEAVQVVATRFVKQHSLSQGNLVDVVDFLVLLKQRNEVQVQMPVDDGSSDGSINFDILQLEPTMPPDQLADKELSSVATVTAAVQEIVALNAKAAEEARATAAEVMHARVSAAEEKAARVAAENAYTTVVAAAAAKEDVIARLTAAELQAKFESQAREVAEAKATEARAQVEALKAQHRKSTDEVALQQQALHDANELREEAEVQFLVEQQEAAQAAEARVDELRREQEAAIKTTELQAKFESQAREVAEAKATEARAQVEALKAQHRKSTDEVALQQQALHDANELREEAEVQFLVEQQEAAQAAEARVDELRREQEAAIKGAEAELQIQARKASAAATKRAVIDTKAAQDEAMRCRKEIEQAEVLLQEERRNRQYAEQQVAEAAVRAVQAEEVAQKNAQDAARKASAAASKAAARQEAKAKEQADLYRKDAQAASVALERERAQRESIEKEMQSRLEAAQADAELIVARHTAEKEAYMREFEQIALARRRVGGPFEVVEDETVSRTSAQREPELAAAEPMRPAPLGEPAEATMRSPTGRIGVPIPSEGEEQEETQVEVKLNPVSPWVGLLDESGDEYFYNQRTGESSWDPPPEGVSASEALAGS